MLTFCSASAAGTNFAGATSLLVRSLGTGQQCQSFLRFPLGSPGGIVLSAKFRLFGRRAVASTETDSVYAVPASDPSAIGRNHNHVEQQAGTGALQGQPVALTTTEKYQEWDVTPLSMPRAGPVPSPQASPCDPPIRRTRWTTA